MMTKKTITISSHMELIDFINRSDITISQSIEVTAKYLNVIILDPEKTKNELINEILHYATFKNEKPIFLDKLES